MFISLLSANDVMFDLNDIFIHHVGHTSGFRVLVHIQKEHRRHIYATRMMLVSIQHVL